MNGNEIENGKVDIIRSPIVIPTYIPHEADKNPIYHEKRAYQGASGKIYPAPITDRLSHKKVDKEYDSVTLENEYIKIMVLPEIGGRIHVGLDKTNNYNFIYHNTVIKPALIGIGGSWISGGIEFNWPQHHRPTTFMPLETVLEENTDGSRTVWVGEIEPLYRTKSMAGVTVYPGRSYLKVKGRAYNRTPFPQQFMWWANLGVHVNENYRITFPQDVKCVAFHDRAFISEWPILKGKYADLDFKDGVDGTWFKNHYAAGSFMVMDGSTDFDFLEGYDMGKEAGIVHVANHHVSPGKKLFTWGNREFAREWKNNLTDDDGHYVELMTGMYTDNQPDFSWMQPNETRVFEHCWYPVKKIGMVKNATEDAAVSMEIGEDEIRLGFHATGKFEGCFIVLKADEKLLLEQKLDIDPANPYMTTVKKPEGIEDYQLFTAIYSENGRELVTFRPLKQESVILPKPRTPSPEPKDIRETEELYIHGLHIEQYRHHSLNAEDYYLEALKRDPLDIRCNNAMGLQHLKRGLFESAEAYFLKARERLTLRNTNPYDGEPLYNLGVVCRYLGKYKEAYDFFYKAVWNYSWKSSAYHALAELDCRNGDFEKALFHINQSLANNSESIRSRDLKAAILRNKGCLNEAQELSETTIKLDLLDFWARYERYLIFEDLGKKADGVNAINEMNKMLQGKVEMYIDLAVEYTCGGLYSEATRILQIYLDTCDEGKASPIAYYYLGYLNSIQGYEEKAVEFCRGAENMCPDYCFPNRLESIAVLKNAQELNPEGPKAFYYLGNLLFDKRRYDEALGCWGKSQKLDDSFSIVNRNLALVYFDKKNDYKKAIQSMEKAFACNTNDSRLLFELLQLYKNSNAVSVEERLLFLQGHDALVAERNDCYLEMIILLFQSGRIQEAAYKITNHVYDIYEGGEGKLPRVYEWIQIFKGMEALNKGDFDTALKEILKTLELPDYFHEGRHNVARLNHVYYYAGRAAEMAGLKKKATEYYEAASSSGRWVNEATFYQGLAVAKLGREEEARKDFESLVTEGDALVATGGKYSFFATGVPTPPPFESDREKRNVSEGLYLKALGYYGLGLKDKAHQELENVIKWNASHLGAWIQLGKSGEAVKLQDL